MNNNNLVEMAEQMKLQGNILYENVKYVEEVVKEVRKSESNIMKVGSFMVDFYNEYREHDSLTMAQCKEIKEAQHAVTSAITRIIAPRMDESRKRGSEYLVVWNRVNKGIWSIFKRNVNGVSIPYDRTPKIKFEQALAYLKSLTVADYLAYKDARWSDITQFQYTEVLDEDKITLQKIVGNNSRGFTNKESSLLLNN